MTVLIGAYGNSLRSLVKNLDSISDNDVAQLENATGVPRVYDCSISGTHVDAGPARILTEL